MNEELEPCLVCGSTSVRVDPADDICNLPTIFCPHCKTIFTTSYLTYGPLVQRVGKDEFIKNWWNQLGRESPSSQAEDEAYQEEVG
jgi:hypothetical protein